MPDAMLRDVEAEWGNPYESGTNDSLRYMAHLREPLRAVPKPLAWYLLAEGLAGIKHAVMLAAGFTCSAHAGFLCYTQGLPPPAAAESADAGRSEGKSAGVGEGAAPAPAPAPLVFSHGVGLGLLPYLPFVMRLAALGRPMVAIEYPHLAMRWTRFIPTVDEVRRRRGRGSRLEFMLPWEGLSMLLQLWSSTCTPHALPTSLPLPRRGLPFVPRARRRSWASWTPTASSAPRLWATRSGPSSCRACNAWPRSASSAWRCSTPCACACGAAT